MKLAKLLATLALFIFISVLAVKTILQAKESQHLKADSAEINHFKYGLFNVNAWKDQLSVIIAEEIDKFYLTRTNEKTLKSHLEDQLEVLIDKIYERLRKINSETANGRFKQSLIDSFVDVKDIKSGIPEYAKAMLQEMSSPKVEKQIKSMIKDKINKYMQETFDTRPETLKEKIIRKLGAADEDIAKEMIAKKINRSQDRLNEWAVLMVLAAVLMFALNFFSKAPLEWPTYFALSGTLLVLLAGGATTPMMDMEAKITEFYFVLFDHPVHFKNQILYFQSKSVLDVFNVMINHKDVPMKMVGVLIVSFSVIFPCLKMLCSLFHYYDWFRARSRKLIQFFVLKSGKWSMADVLVVAIFMAYIGFNGIINSQLVQMKEYSENVDLMTTNGTSLQPGFYVFFSYTILAMFLSLLLERRAPQEC